MKLTCLALTLLLPLTLGLNYQEDDLVFDDITEETSPPPTVVTRHEVKTYKAKAYKKIRRFRGIPDGIAVVGQVFKLKIPKQAFSGNVDSYDIRGNNGKPLPYWIAFDDEASTILGVPSKKDEGQHRITVKAHGKNADTAEDNFTIRVVNGNHREIKKTNSQNRCDESEAQIVMTILLDARFDSLRPSVKVEAIENLAKFLRLDVNDLFMYAAGNVKRRKEKDSSVIEWQVGCDDHLWKNQSDILEQLRYQAKNGTLSKVVQLPVLLWRVKTDTSDLLRNRRETGSGDYGNNDDENDDDYDENYDYDGEDSFNDPDNERDNTDDNDNDNEAITEIPPRAHVPSASEPKGFLPSETEHPHRHHHGQETVDWETEERVKFDEILRASNPQENTINTTTSSAPRLTTTEQTSATQNSSPTPSIEPVTTTPKTPIQPATSTTTVADVPPPPPPPPSQSPTQTQQQAQTAASTKTNNAAILSLLNSSPANSLQQKNQGQTRRISLNASIPPRVIGHGNVITVPNTTGQVRVSFSSALTSQLTGKQQSVKATAVRLARVQDNTSTLGLSMPGLSALLAGTPSADNPIPGINTASTLLERLTASSNHGNQQPASPMTSPSPTNVSLQGVNLTNLPGSINGLQNVQVSFPGLSQSITMPLNVSAATASVTPTGVIVSLPISSGSNICTTVSSMIGATVVTTAVAGTTPTVVIANPANTHLSLPIAQIIPSGVKSLAQQTQNIRNTNTVALSQKSGQAIQLVGSHRPRLNQITRKAQPNQVTSTVLPNQLVTVAKTVTASQLILSGNKQVLTPIMATTKPLLMATQANQAIQATPSSQTVPGNKHALLTKSLHARGGATGQIASQTQGIGVTSLSQQQLQQLQQCLVAQQKATVVAASNSPNRSQIQPRGAVPPSTDESL
ncbi:myb-like protein U isoform X1 [Diachasma alloeum]|uniref:myb-like protein U isoform X1 n=1 Tax=Diachasma alloeum TaxID=454923 RepID=UPI0007381D69|nr:myb-like protein U isoform X1 [Diachasma alloeum]